jgi:hypothetical protein
MELSLRLMVMLWRFIKYLPFLQPSSNRPHFLILHYLNNNLTPNQYQTMPLNQSTIPLYDV